DALPIWIENYSRILAGRPAGSAPPTLLDYFPSDYVVFVDESHQTVPQVGGMYEGDRSRKQTLVDFGFRLPSALGRRKPKSTSVCFRERSPSYMPPTCGTVWCDSSTNTTKSDGK